MRRLLAGAAVALATVIATVAPAAAHAELRDTTPANGAVLDTAPPVVELSFSEPVEVSIGGIRVYDSNGDRLDRTSPHHPDGRSDTVALDLDDMPDGSYVVTWRVVSADSHPVHGAFTFRVGEGPASADTQALATRLLAADGGNTTVGAVYAGLRVAVFGSLLLLVGGGAFVVAVWPAGMQVRRSRRFLAAAWVTAAAATAVAIGVQGAYGGGLGLADAADPDVLSAVLDTRFGTVSLLRLVLLTAVAVVAVMMLRRDTTRTGPIGVGVFAVIGAALLATPGLAGHASTGRWVPLAVPLDTIHLGAVAIWIGGLALLAGVVLRQRDAHDLEAVVPRFSRIALGAVIVIMATGVLQSIRQLGSIDALTDTTYGRLLAIKVAVFAVMVGLAAASRGWVRRHYTRHATNDPRTGDPGATVGRLRRTVAAETAAAVVVLAVTALLVNAIPGRTALALPLSTEIEASENLLIDVTVDPAKAGPLDLHLYTLSPAGLPLEVEDLTATLGLPDRDIGPLKVPLQRAGPNHFVTYAFDLPIPGNWNLTVTARTSDVDQDTASTTVRIR